MGEATAVWANAADLKKTAILLAAVQAVLIILFGIFTGKGNQFVDPLDLSKNAFAAYSMFSGVAVMMFVGFGYLMTFAKHYGVSAVGFTMVITAIGLQWAVLTEAFFGQWMELADDIAWHAVDVTIYNLLDGLYAVSAVLITFGALIGKVSPFQLMIITLIELAIHSLNYKVILGGLYVADMGGTYIDHMLGAYFGLAVAWVLGKPKGEPATGHIPDVFSLIGTTFLWLYWPSFVAGAAEAGSVQQQVAIVNTFLALSSSTITAFFTSSFMNEKSQFRPVDIQNATLAGGVAVGCIANLSIKPIGAISIGIIASVVSTWGFNSLQPYLEEKWSLHDTCGVHNLHGLTSIVGGLASVVVCAVNKDTDALIFGEHASEQWWRQLVGMLATLSLAVITGLATGYLVQHVGPEQDSTVEFEDSEWWEVADDYTGAKKEEKVATEEVELTNSA